MFAEQSIAEKQRKGKLKRRSCANSWQPITQNDIQLYVAVLIYQGLIWKCNVHMNIFYTYTINIFFSTTGVPAIMPQQKFVLIEKYLHSAENTTLQSTIKEIKIACQSLIILLIHSAVIIYQKVMFPLMHLYC